jgi:hypothetical protein
LIPGWARAIYATDQFFFVAGVAEGAVLRAFDISDPHGAIVAAGEMTMPGNVVDKLNMDLRGTTFTAVSTGWRTDASGGSPFSQVATFSLADPQHPVALGTLEGPPGEDLFTTRFDGTRLYLVTMVGRGDPLAIIDLSNPAQPTLLGRVELPGNFTVIQPLGDRLLATGLVNSLPVLDLYDVGNPAAPALLTRVSLGQSAHWMSTHDVFDPKAFNVIPESNLILLPVANSGAGGQPDLVQVIDLLPDSLVKRGVIPRPFSPHGAGLKGGRILSVSAYELLTVNADDRDHPAITGDLDIAWPVDRTFLLGPWLIELGGNVAGNSVPAATVAPAGDPDGAASTLPLPNADIEGAAVRGGVLYVLQAATNYRTITWANSTYTAQVIDGTNLTLSTIDVSHLPAVKLLGQCTIQRATANYPADLKPLWVNDRTLIFSGRNIRYMSPPVNNLNASPLTANAGASSTTSGGNSVFSQYLRIGNGFELFAYDVTSSNQPKLASHFTFGDMEPWIVGEPLAGQDTVYFSYQAPSLFRLNPQSLPPGAIDPANRHFLKRIDYSHSAAPVMAEAAVTIPGELRALAGQGTLLYTVGPLLHADGALDGPGSAVQASRFDGATAYLLDQLPLASVTQPFLVSGDAFLLLHPEPARLWHRDEKTGFPSSTPNPAVTTLDTWSLGDDGKFSQAASLTLTHELSLGELNNLGVLRNNDPSVRLLDLTDPLHPVDFGIRPVDYNGASSLDHADGGAHRGLWLPVGPNGVNVDRCAAKRFATTFSPTREIRRANTP